MKKFPRFAFGAAVILASFSSGAGAQETTTLSTLLSQGFEIKAMTTVDLDPSDGTDEGNIFVVVQDGPNAFGCVLRSVNRSLCQRIE